MGTSLTVASKKYQTLFRRFGSNFSSTGTHKDGYAHNILPVEVDH